MKKTFLILCLIVFVFNLSGNLVAQESKLFDELDSLSNILTKSLMNYELRQKQFNVHMPYEEIIEKRKVHITELNELIRKLNGEPKEAKAEVAVIEKMDNVVDAMMIDAREEIKIIDFCNKLLHGYDNPDVQEFATKLKDESNVAYMLFNNHSHFAMMPTMRTNIDTRSDYKAPEKQEENQVLWSTEQSDISGHSEF